MSFLEQLENNEAVLLMYLSGELPLQDQVEVEQMLAHDAALRADLERLRATQVSVNGVLRESDLRNEAPPAAAAATHRQVMRMMRQWAIENPTHMPQKPALKRLKYPWWTYPIAASIAIFFAFLAWWGNTEPTNRPDQLGAGMSIPIDEATARRLDSSLALSEDFNRTQDDAERQIAFYRQNVEDDTPLMPF